MSEQERIKQAQDVKTLRENMPAILDAMPLIARATRAKYLALLKEGFTEQQAIELSKSL